MNWLDLINGGFELWGGFAVLQNIIRTHRDKRIAGIDWRSNLFFTVWGFWNCVFYPHLGQWVSFAGGALLAITNLIWFCQILYYKDRPCRSLNFFTKPAPKTPTR